MSLDRHDLRAIAERDQAVDRVKHFGSDNVCTVASDDSDSEADSDSDGGDRREVVRAADRSGSYASLPLAAILFALAFLNPTAAFARGVTEQSSGIAHPYVGVLVFALFALGCRCTAVIADRALEAACLHALLDALREANITHKEACALMAIQKSHWSEILAGQLHTPSHSRMLNLPWNFWQAYLPKLANVLVTHKLGSMVSDEQERRLSA